MSYCLYMTPKRLTRCYEYVGWASAMMAFAGMGSLALMGTAADLLR